MFTLILFLWLTATLLMSVIDGLRGITSGLECFDTIGWVLGKACKKFG